MTPKPNDWIRVAELWKDQNLLAWIGPVLAGGSSKKTFDRFDALAFAVFVERSLQHFGRGQLEDPGFELSPTLIAFQELVYIVNVFKLMRVRTEKWQPAIDALFQALSEMVETGRLDFDSELCRQTRGNAAAVMTRLRAASPAMEQKFEDLLNGAL